MIAKAGKPLVKVMPLAAPVAGQILRLGFMAGQVAVPDDFDRMGEVGIEGLFGDPSMYMGSSAAATASVGAMGSDSTSSSGHGAARRSHGVSPRRD